MSLKLIALEDPIKLCAICHLHKDQCDAKNPGPHIYDGLAFRYVIQDDDGGAIHSFHISKAEAKKALRDASR